MSEEEMWIEPGPAYLEELDPQLHEFNRLAHRGMQASIRSMDAFKRGDREEWAKASRDHHALRQQYRKAWAQIEGDK